MAPILEPLVDSSVLYDSPGLAILLATSGAALLACIAGGLAFYAFSLVDAKADSVSNIEDVEKRRRNTTVWNNTNSTLREEASKKCAGLDPAAAARAIEELCGLGEVGSKATSEKQLKRYNEQLCHRLRRQFTSRVQPSQWNLPAILELAEAASFAATAADEHGDDQLSGRSRKASLLVRQPGRLRFANCGEKSAKMFVAQRAGVAKVSASFRKRHYACQSSGHGNCRRRYHQKTRLHPSKLAEALAGSQVRRPSWTPVTRSAQNGSLQTPSPLPHPPTPLAQQSASQEDSLNNQQSSESKQRRLKLMLRLSQQLDGSSSSGRKSNTAGSNKSKQGKEKDKADRESSPSTTCGVLQMFSSSSGGGGGGEVAQGDGCGNNSVKGVGQSSTLSTASGAPSASAES
uniref:LEM domain-containing protein n=1 Tax=Macrostomum lignano TaxID=282301 RepID=A0A1I8IH37_9PLAT